MPWFDQGGARRNRQEGGGSALGVMGNMKNDFSGQESAFSGCFTLNPQKVLSAWRRLNVDEASAMVGLLPIIIHEALNETLEERNISVRNIFEQAGANEAEKRPAKRGPYKKRTAAQ